jgi:hypothetical protein
MASLTSLPLEVRMQIWELALPEAIELTWSKESSKQSFPNPSLALLLLNKQTKDEIKDLEIAKICLRIDDEAFDDFMKHLPHLPISFHHSIKTIEIIKISPPEQARKVKISKWFQRSPAPKSPAGREMVVRHQRLRLLSESWLSVKEVPSSPFYKHIGADKWEIILETTYEVSGIRLRASKAHTTNS